MDIINQVLPFNPDYEFACSRVETLDKPLWQPVVDYICQRHQLSCEQFDQDNGWANVILDLHNQLMVKIVPPNWQSQAQSELVALALLADRELPIAVPGVHASGEINGWQYMVIDKLPGVNLHNIWSELSIDNRCLIAEQLGQVTRQINELPINQATAIDLDWPKFLAQQSQNCYARHQKHGLNATLLADYQRFIDTVNYQPNCDLFNQGQARLLHTDLHPGNLMAEQRDGVWYLSGVLDFGDAMVAPELYFEIATPLMFLGLANKQVNHAFLTGYGLDIAPADYSTFAEHLMALSLLRHTGDIHYVLKTVPGCASLDNWSAISRHCFAL